MPLQLEFKRQYVAALRSGKYTQCRSRLRTKSLTGAVCHCGVGVACDLVDPAGWKDTKTYDELGELTGYSCYRVEGGMGSMPISIQNLIGMSDVQHKQLVLLNDIKAWTFEEIANFVERTM